MAVLGRSIAVALVFIAGCQSVSAQIAQPAPPSTDWNLDVAATVGVRPGLGAATTGPDGSVAVTVVRSTHSGIFGHRCSGLTTMFSLAPGEQLLLAGPRWDAGDQEGTAFFRLLGGVRKLTETAPGSNGLRKSSESGLAIGAGVGVAVGGVLLDVNWIVSPWSELAKHRLTVSAGYIWSVPFKGGS
jgi:hypothetical protein